MSNFLAIATVTATLSQLIQDAIEVDVPGASVSTVRPDIAGKNIAEAKVNIFLYQVTTNTAFRNTDLPTRNGNGSLSQRPKVALDLHYLLTFYGEEISLVPQRLMGSTVRTLHGEPFLTRERIADKVNALTFLHGSNLAEDVELIKFTPMPLSLEELSKLWSVLIQTPYAPSIVYQGSVVLIESEEIPSQALPVKMANVYAMPFRQPVIEQLLSQKKAGQPVLANQPIVTNDTLILAGRQLQSSNPAITTMVQIANTSLPYTASDSNRLSLAVPNALHAGVQGVQVVQQMNIGPNPPRPHNSFESNIVPFVLHPTINTASKGQVQAEGNGLFKANVTTRVTPSVGSKQRVVLLLNEAPGNASSISPAAYAFLAEERSTDSATITFAVRDVKAASYLVRIQVDGAESAFDQAKLLTIP